MPSPLPYRSGLRLIDRDTDVSLSIIVTPKPVLCIGSRIVKYPLYILLPNVLLYNGSRKLFYWKMMLMKGTHLSARRRQQVRIVCRLRSDEALVLKCEGVKIDYKCGGEHFKEIAPMLVNLIPEVPFSVLLILKPTPGSWRRTYLTCRRLRWGKAMPEAAEEAIKTKRPLTGY